jgi:gas vesicle protein
VSASDIAICLINEYLYAFDIGMERKMSDNFYDGPSRTGSTFTAFLIGGLIGGAVALLYAPRSGEETREILLNQGQETADRVMQSLRDAQTRLEAMNEDTRERLQRLQVIAQETLDEEKQIFDKRYGQVKEVMNKDTMRE